MNNITQGVKHLIIINVIFFLIQGFVPYFENLTGLWFPLNQNYRYWQLLTHMFTHAGVMHLFFNMFALYSFGVILESHWGTNKFLWFYFVCGIGACLLHIGVNLYHYKRAVDTLVANNFDYGQILELLKNRQYMPAWADCLGKSGLDNFIDAYWGNVVGASGAIYGILVAFAMMFPQVELGIIFIPIGFKAKYFVPFIICLDLLSGITGFSIFGANIAHFAHVGGALVGYLMMTYFRKAQTRQ